MKTFDINTAAVSSEETARPEHEQPCGDPECCFLICALAQRAELRAKLAAYVPMSDEELEEIGEAASDVRISRRLWRDGRFARAQYEFRAIEQAVLARLGVGS